MAYWIFERRGYHTKQHKKLGMIERMAAVNLIGGPKTPN
jgi:uncharacterized protein YjlB